MAKGWMRAAGLGALLVLGCDSGGSTAKDLTIAGRVFAADRGTPLADVEVRTHDGAVVKTDREGRFVARQKARARSSLSVEKNGYAPVSKRAPEGDGYVELFVKDVDERAEVTTKTPARVKTTSGVAVTIREKTGFVAKDGATVEKAQVEVASPDPRKPSALPAIPGDFDARQGSKAGKLSAESPVYVRASDSKKGELSLAPDKNIEAELPVRRASGPDEGALFHFDPSEQTWVFVKKVKRTERPVSTKAAKRDEVYVASLDALGWWTIGELFDELTCVRACVVDARGKGVPYARAIATGVDHFTQLSTYADADGCFALDVRAKAQVSLAVQASDGFVPARLIETGEAGPSVADDASRCTDVGRLELEAPALATCPLGFRECGEACVDVESDPERCGTCDNACDGTRVAELSCVAGTCECALGQRVCTTAGRDYCASLNIDDDHCGACDNRCEAGTECRDGECVDVSLADAGTIEPPSDASTGDAGTSTVADASTPGKPALSLSPLSQAFGPARLSSDSAVHDFTFENMGDGAATGCMPPTLSGAHASEFSIVSDGCGSQDLPAGASCTVTLKATPTADGERTATLSRSCVVGGLVQSASNGLFVNRPHYLFITSTESDGNLGGLSGADATCATHAAAGSLTQPLNQTWRALLSVAGTVDARDRIAWTGPVYDVRNLLATRDPSTWPWTVDGTGSPDPNLLAASEDGASVGSYVWTGTHEDGTAQGTDCLGWTSNSSAETGHAGENGNFSSSTAWISSFSNGCSDTFFALICVSDGPAP